MKCVRCGFRLSVILVLFGGMLSRGSADLTVVHENVDSVNSTPIRMTVMVKGKFVRQDMEMSMGAGNPALPFPMKVSTSRIRERGKAGSLILDHGKKNYRRVSASQEKEEAEIMAQHVAKGGFAGAATVPQRKPELRATGKKETVNGCEADIYESETPEIKFFFWISEKFPGGVSGQQWKEFKEADKEFSDNLGTRNMERHVPDLSAVGGITVRTRMERSGGPIGKLVVTTDLVSVDDAEIAESEFEIPEGYTP